MPDRLPRSHPPKQAPADANPQVFLLLVFEMSLFVALIVPMPFVWKRKLFTFISHNKYVSKLQYWLKVRRTHIHIRGRVRQTNLPGSRLRSSSSPSSLWTVSTACIACNSRSLPLAKMTESKLLPLYPSDARG